MRWLGRRSLCRKQPSYFISKVLSEATRRHCHPRWRVTTRETICWQESFSSRCIRTRGTSLKCTLSKSSRAGSQGFLRHFNLPRAGGGESRLWGGAAGLRRPRSNPAEDMIAIRTEHRRDYYQLSKRFLKLIVKMAPSWYWLTISFQVAASWSNQSGAS